MSTPVQHPREGCARLACGVDKRGVVSVTSLKKCDFILGKGHSLSGVATGTKGMGVGQQLVIVPGPHAWLWALWVCDPSWSLSSACGGERTETSFLITSDGLLLAVV